MADSPFKVRKRCWECSYEWDGYSFVEHPQDAAPLPGTCSRCLDAHDGLVKAVPPPVANRPSKPMWYERD